jgi:F-type H+-transporting ATPase subunit alpha
VARVGEFERRALEALKASDASVLDAIRNEKQISPATEEKLKAFFADFVKKFA